MIDVERNTEGEVNDSNESTDFSRLNADIDSQLGSLLALNIPRHAVFAKSRKKRTDVSAEVVKSSDKPKNKSKDKSQNKPKKSQETLTSKNSVKFPSGVRLRKYDVPKDALGVNKLWEVKFPDPKELFRGAFPGMTYKNSVITGVSEYLRVYYTNDVPIVKITSGDLKKKLSPHFTVADAVRIDPNDKVVMEKAKLWKKYEKFMITYNGNYYWAFARIDPNLFRQLELVRKEAGGYPIYINEGVRPYQYNLDMYRASHSKPHPSSPHITGRAVDIKNPDIPRRRTKLINAMRKVLTNKGGGIGIGPTTIHFDVKIRPSSWQRKNTKSRRSVGLKTHMWGY